MQFEAKIRLIFRQSLESTQECLVKVRQAVLTVILISRSTCFLSLTLKLKLIDCSLHSFFRNMSSKRKSPPTKFQEGGGLVTPEDDGTVLLPATISVPNTLSSAGCGGSDGGGLTDVDESSSNNVSDVGDEDPPGSSQGATAASLYKLSDSSSSSPVSGSEPEDCPVETHEPSPPSKKQRLLCPAPPQDIEFHNNIRSSLVPPPSALLPALSAIHLQHEHHQYQEPVDSSGSRRRSSSDCSSPTLDIMMKAGTVNNHNNNNNSTTHNNNSTSSSHPVKRTMDDVLKRLTSKMHISNVRDEKRPTPASTPTGKPVG